MNKRILLGMSGGVDSAVAAVLLKEQGYEVVGATMQLFNCENSSKATIEDAKRVCEFLNIEHHIIDFKEDFKKHVVDNFICEYKRCRTPNPCIECNKHLKFGAMYNKAKELNCEYIATGHYAKIEFNDIFGRNVLKMSNAGKKDQSYVLYNITTELLDIVRFPLGEFNNKDEIREIAKKYNLPVASKPDSEDICFIPDGDYKKFLEDNSDIVSKSGNIVHVDGKILGKHTGLYKYTIGQRKGLGISNPVPLFVVGFNAEKNELIVGEQDKLYTKEFWVNDINFLYFDNLKDAIEVDVKTRYSAKVAKAKIEQIGNEVKVIFDEPQKAVTPGQSAVFYIGDVVIGGGKIK